VIVLWSFLPRYSSYVVGWDLQVYRNAAHALAAGHDPYLDGIAVQDEFHRTLAQHSAADAPFTYVYSPLTLPFLRLMTRLPHVLCMTVYWTLSMALGSWPHGVDGAKMSGAGSASSCFALPATRPLF